VRKRKLPEILHPPECAEELFERNFAWLGSFVTMQQWRSMSDMSESLAAAAPDLDDACSSRLHCMKPLTALLSGRPLSINHVRLVGAPDASAGFFSIVQT
jgi:hypothetical protein